MQEVKECGRPVFTADSLYKQLPPMVHEETTAKQGVMLSILFLVLTRKQASLANHSYPVGKSSFIANDKHLLTTQILTPDQP